MCCLQLCEQASDFRLGALKRGFGVAGASRYLLQSFLRRLHCYLHAVNGVGGLLFSCASLARDITNQLNRRFGVNLYCGHVVGSSAHIKLPRKQIQKNSRIAELC